MDDLNRMKKLDSICKHYLNVFSHNDCSVKRIRLINTTYEKFTLKVNAKQKMTGYGKTHTFCRNTYIYILHVTYLTLSRAKNAYFILKKKPHTAFKLL